MSIEQEYFNQILPAGNTPATRGMFQVPANPTGGVVDLAKELGPTGGSHFMELKAMASGASVHIAFSNSPTYTIGFGQMGGTGGVYTGVGWPMLHGETIRGRVPYISTEQWATAPGYPTAGYRATLAPAAYLHYRTPPGTPTGSVLHGRWASIEPGQKAGDANGFPVPGRT